MDSAHAGGGHVGKGARIASLRRIDGVHGAQEDPLVVGMSGDDQKVRPLDGGIRLGIAVGQPAGAQDSELADAEGLPPGGELKAAAPLRQGHGVAEAVDVQIGGKEQRPLLIVLPQGHMGILCRHAEKQSAHDPVPLGTDMQNVSGVVRVVGHVFAVVGIEGVGLRIVLDEGKVPGDVFRFWFGLLRPHGHDAEQHQDGQAQDPGKQPSVVHGAHILLL